jgi:hypothetical protein
MWERRIMPQTVYAPLVARTAHRGMDRLRAEAAEGRTVRAMAELSAEAAWIRIRGGSQADLDGLAARAEATLAAELIVTRSPGGAVALRDELEALARAHALASPVLVGVDVPVPNLLLPPRAAGWIKLIVTEVMYGLATAASREQAVEQVVSGAQTASLLSLTVRCERLDRGAQPSERGREALERAHAVAAALSGAMWLGEGQASLHATVELPLARLGRRGA